MILRQQEEVHLGVTIERATAVVGTANKGQQSRASLRPDSFRVERPPVSVVFQKANSVVLLVGLDGSPELLKLPGEGGRDVTGIAPGPEKS